MNMTTNSTAPQFTFTINDGIFIAIQGFTYFLMLLLLLLLFLFRKEKELKTRGSVPFFSVFGVFLLSIRLIAGNLSFLKITNSLSFSYKFSCWWSLIISAPVLTLFVVLQTLTTIQYFINKRIDSLKDLTWELYDTKNEKATKKMEKNSKKVQEVNSNSKTSSKRFSLRNINSKRLSVNLSSSKSELLSPNSKNARKSLGNTEIHNKSENPPRKVSKENSPRELSDIFSSENQTPNSDQEVTSNERVSMDLDTEDHKLLKNILFKMKIAKFLSSNILKIFLVLIVFLGVILFQAAINGVLEIVTSPNLCTFDKMLFSNGISSLATPIALILFTFIYFMCFIADIIIFTKQNGFKMKLYFTVDDPFGFRIEMFIDLIILTAGIFISFSTFIGNAIYQRIEIPGVYTVRGEIINIGTTIFLILAQWFVLFAMVGIPLLFAVISYIKRKFEPTIYETEFDAFINSKEGKAIFKKFAKKEWSLENILFYEEVEKYKKVWSMKFAKKRAEEILSNYIEVGSTLEINISGEVRKLTKKKIQNFKDYKDDYKNIFNESIKETKRNMRDTYARIRRTLEYSVWKTSSKVLVDETMNTTNSTEAVFTFTVSDGIFITLQSFTYFLLILLIILLIIFRNQKELKTRGSMPYFSIGGIFLLSIRFLAQNFSFLKISNPQSYTYNFPCWFSLIISAPITTLFVIAQLLTMMQYFLNKRMDNLKDLTWGLYDHKNEAADIKIEKKIKKKQESNRSPSNRNSSKNKTVDLSARTKKNFKKSEEVLLQKLDETYKTIDSTIDRDDETTPKSIRNLQQTETEITSTEVDRSSYELDTEDLKTLKSLIFKMKLFKFFSSNFFKIILIIISYTCVILGHAAINGVLELSSPLLCNYHNIPLANGISSLIGNFTVVLTSILYIFMVLFDIVPFIREHGINFKSYFIQDDPFRYRIEMFIDSLFLVFALTISISTFVLNFITQKIHLAGVTTLRGEIGGIALTLFLIAIEWIITYAMAGLALTFAITSFVQKKFEPTIYDSEFDAFINSKEGKILFKKYAKKEWSLENILFYEEVEKYKKSKNFRFAKKRAEEILSNYIETGSNLEINISGDVRKLTKKKIRNFKDYKSEYKCIFDEAIKETKRNMRDTYSRIRRTLEFSKWKMSTNALIEESTTV